MSTEYPESVDSFPVQSDGGSVIDAAQFQNIQDAVAAVETVLGTDPAGSYHAGQDPHGLGGARSGDVPALSRSKRRSSQMDILSEHIARPRHSGKLVRATGRSELNPVKVEAVAAAFDQVSPRFSSFQDPVLGRIVSCVCEQVHQHGLAVIPELTVKRLTQLLRLPPDKVRCAQLVVLALLEAVQDHQRWKRQNGEVGQ